MAVKCIVHSEPYWYSHYYNDLKLPSSNQNVIINQINIPDLKITFRGADQWSSLTLGYQFSPDEPRNNLQISVWSRPSHGPAQANLSVCSSAAVRLI